VIADQNPGHPDALKPAERHCGLFCITVYVNSYVGVNGHRPDQHGVALMLNALSRSLHSLTSHCLTALIQVHHRHIHTGRSEADITGTVHSATEGFTVQVYEDVISQS